MSSTAGKAGGHWKREKETKPSGREKETEKKECCKKETSTVGLKAVDWVLELATEPSSNTTGKFLKWNSRDEEWLEKYKTKKTLAGKKE